MKKYVLNILYNPKTDEIECVEETIIDLDGTNKVLSIGKDNLRDHLTEDQLRDLNFSFTGEVIKA